MITISNLPIELLCKIIADLDTKIIFGIQCISKQFLKIISNDYLWSIKYPDYEFKKIIDSLRLSYKITRSLKSPIKIYDCYSTEIAITSRNDVLFSEYISGGILHKYNGNKITNIRGALSFFQLMCGEYYRDGTNNTCNSIYTGKICDSVMQWIRGENFYFYNPLMILNQIMICY